MVVRMLSMSADGANARGAHRQLVGARGSWAIGLVELVGDRAGVGIDRLNVGDDSDDLTPFRGLAAGLCEAVADGALFAEHTAAMAWLMTKTLGERAESLVLKVRPRSRGVPTVSK